MGEMGEFGGGVDIEEKGGVGYCGGGILRSRAQPAIYHFFRNYFKN